MAVTENTYTASGSNALYSFTFPYIDTTDIKVSLDGVVKTISTHYTLASATQVQFNTAPTNGQAVRIYRETNTNQKKSTFFSGSSVRAQDLNDNFDQTLYATQEASRDVVAFPNEHWNNTTETITSSETWPGSGSGDNTTVATTAAIQAQINATSPALVDTTKLPLSGGTVTGEVIYNYVTSVQMPSGTTAQRPGSPTNGDFRYNSDDSSFEGYQGGSWGAVGGGATGPSGNAVFWENDQTVSDDYTITNNKNAGSFGPITVATGKTVTVGAGEVWTVV
jgi:hypothetical protein